MWLRHSRALALWILLLPGVTLGQEPAAPATPPVSQPQPEKSPPQAPASAAGPIREEEPAVYLLPDGKGGYKPVINFQLDKFKQLLELERQVETGTGKPAYSVELRGQAVADGNRARVELEFQCAVPADGWVRLPLRLDEAVIVAQKHQGAGEYVLVPADEGQGFVAWLKGGTGEPHRLQVTALVPISRVGGEARLHLSLPRLTTSEFTLRVPMREASIRTPQGGVLEQVPGGNGDETTVRTVGASGAIDFAWRESAKEAGIAPAVLSASGAIQVQLDGQAATTTATLNITAAEGTVDRFQVLLPTGATLISGEAAGYSVTPQADASRADATAEPAVQIEVRPLDAPAKQVALRLVTEQLLPAPGAAEHVDLAGFEVVGARHQTGFLALRVVGDWQLVFGDRRNVREVALGDLPAALRSPELVAAFEYLAQPAALLARVVPRRPRVAVDPLYVYRITPDAIELEARFRYTIRGARVFALDLEFPDEAWEIEEIGPAGLVDLDGVLFEQLQPLSVPLLQPGSGELELRCRARRMLDPDQSQVSFKLPRPLANSVGPAKVIVLPADNVELTPRNEELIGLGRQASASVVDLPPHQQEPLVYRGDVAKAHFAADRRVLKQTVTAQVATQINLRERLGTVEQQLRFQVRYEPLERIALRVPSELLGERAAEVQLDGQRVQWIADRLLDAQAAGTQLVYIPLPKPLLGSAEVRVRFTLPEQKLTPRVSVPLAVPLVTPAISSVLQNEALVLARPGLEVHPRGEAWKLADNSLDLAEKPDQLRLVADAPASELGVALNLADPEAFGATVIERAWIQTWLGEQNRQDRAVLQVNSRQSSLKFALPSSAVANSVDIRVDGERVAAKQGADASYSVPLDSRAERDQHTVEIAYDLPRETGISLNLVPPRFGDNLRVGNTYWQVVLPKHEHVVIGPRNYGAEFTWGWQGYFWGREPRLEQFDLETWAGAAPHSPLPTSTNRYLYSTLGAPTALHVRVAPRWSIVLAASGLALVAGLALVYVPRLRRAGLLWVAAIILIAVGVIYPEPTLMLLQAASLGALLTLVAGVLKRSLARRPAPRAGSTLIRPGSSIARREAEPYLRPAAMAGSNSSTETGPLAGQLSTPDSNS